mgnify:CR=1 FL=1
MGQIYEKKEKTDVAQSSFRVTQLSNNIFNNTDELKRNAEREKAEALDMYAKGLHLSASQSMADMFNENQNDPQKLQEMFNGLNDKMSAEIPDIETKIGFKADFLVQSQSYLNRARNNQKRIQLVKQREQNEQMMLDWSKSYSNSFYNMLTPDSTPDDLVNFVRSRDGIENILKARNEDGTLIYSPLQQERIRDSLKKVQVDSIKSYFNDLPDYEKVNFNDSLASNKVMVKSAMIFPDSKEDVVLSPITDFMDDEAVREIKSYTKDYMTKIKENDYLSPEEANKRAIANLVAINELDTRKTTIFSQEKGKKGKIAKGVSVSDVLGYRDVIKQYRIDGTITDKEYAKYMSETVNPLLDLVNSYDPEEGIPDPNMGKVYQKVINELDPNGVFDNQTRAYLLNQAYDMLSKQGLDPSEGYDSDNKNIIVNISNRIKQDYLADKDPMLLGKDIDNVVMGNNIYSYSQGKGTRNVKGSGGEYRRSPDGKIYKIYRDASGMPINKILVRG